MVINATAPEGTSYEAMYDYIGKLISLVDTLPEKDYIVSVTPPDLEPAPRLTADLCD